MMSAKGVPRRDSAASATSWPAMSSVAKCRLDFWTLEITS
jgi:hypothetical protein